MRRYVRIAILIILTLLLAAVFLTGCGDDAGTANDITQVYLSSFPESASIVYYGENLDLSGATLLVTLRSGKTESVNITEDMISDYNRFSVGTQTISVNYAGYTIPAVVNVKALSLSRLEFASLPTELAVVQGGSLDLSQVSLRVIYQNGYSSIVSEVTDKMVRGYNANLQPGTHNIYIDYAGLTIQLDIKVIEKSVIGISIINTPGKNTYFVGAELNPSGLSIKRNFDNSTSDILEYVEGDEDFSFKYDFSKANAYSLVTVTYRKANTASFKVKVMEPTCTRVSIIARPEPVGIHLDPTVKTDLNSLIEGDRIDWSKGEAVVTYNDGTENVVNLSSTEFYVFVDYPSEAGYVVDKEAYTFDNVGVHTVYLRYRNNNFFTELFVTVVQKLPYQLILGDLRQPAESTEEDGSVTLQGEFIEGARFETGMLRYNIRYDNGTYEYPVDNREEWASIGTSMLADDGSTFNLSTQLTDADGYQTVNFTTGGVKNGFKLKVVEKVATDLVVTAPYRDIFIYNSEFDLTGSAIYATFNDNSVVRVSPISREMIELYLNVTDEDGEPLLDTEGNPVREQKYRLNATGTYTAVVTYYKQVREFDFRVVAVNDPDAITAIELIDYNSNEVYYFDNYEAIFNSGIKMKATRANGDVAEYNLTGSDPNLTVLVGDSEATGMQALLLRYRGCTFTFQVYIRGRYVTSVEVERAPDKQVYVRSRDAELDISGLRIGRLYSDNQYGQALSFNPEYWSFTGYDLGKLGVQTVTVTYNSDDRAISTEFQILVADSDIDSIDFDETLEYNDVGNLNGLSKVTIDDRDYYALTVTYKDDLNTTYYYEPIVDGVQVSRIEKLLLTVRLTDGSNKYLPLSAANISYDRNVIKTDSDGNYLQYAEITFNGKTDWIYIHVVKRELIGISVYKNPDKLIYAEGQQLNAAGGYIERTYRELTEPYAITKDILPMTSGLVSFNGYEIRPFDNVEGIKSKEQNIEIYYSGATSSYTITSYRKLETPPTLTGRTRQYGQTVDPVVTFKVEVDSFVTPETKIEYLVNGAWSAETPRYPGSYLIRVTVIGNEYYNDMVWEDEETYVYTVTSAYIIITIPTHNKEYGSADPDKIEYYMADGELVPGDVVDIIVTREPGEDVGSYRITAVLAASGQNQNALYKLNANTAMFIINPKVVGTDRLGNAIDVSFKMPDNFDSITATIPYTANEIREISASYTDGISHVIIGSHDIEYYKLIDGVWQLMTGLPKDIGTYKVKVSSNYTFAEDAMYEREFAIK